MQRGDIIGGSYRILEEIGDGGMGVIYKAYHLRLESYVVIKKIKENFVGCVNARAEVDILKNLRHTCLPKVYDFIQQGSQVYTVMDYIEGYDLGKYLDSGYHFDPAQLVEWMRELCVVLDYLHTQTPPILHSDIKPKNIMVTPTGHMCLIDFNISLEMEEDKEILGISPNYAAPEQVYRARQLRETGRREFCTLDVRSDIYSLGAVFYHLVSGICPSTEDFRKNIPLEHMRLPQFTPAFLALIDKAMQVNPRARYQSAKEMYDKLTDLRKLDKNYRRKRRLQVLSSAACAAAVLLVIGTVLQTMQAQKREAFQKDYRIFYQASQQGNEELVLSQGLHILNADKYGNVLENQLDEKAAIFHEIGSYYYYREEYSTASSYYKQAVQVSDQIEMAKYYYRDYAVCLAKTGDPSLARQTLLRAEQLGLDRGESAYIQAEIVYGNQEYEKAKEEVDALLAQNLDTELKGRAYVLRAEISQNLTDREGQIRYLEKARKTEETTEVLRRLGVAYAQAAQEAEGRDAGKKRYQQAFEVFGTLVSKAYPSFEDWMNYAIVSLPLGKTDECKSVLLKLAEEGKADYRIFMYLAFACERKQEINSMKSYCRRAVELYESSKAAGKENSDEDAIAHLYKIYQGL